MGEIGGLESSSHEHTVRGSSVGAKKGMSVGFHSPRVLKHQRLLISPKDLSESSTMNYSLNSLKGGLYRGLHRELL